MRRSFLVDIATSSRLELSPEELADVERQFSIRMDRQGGMRRRIAVCVGAGLVGALIAQVAAVGLTRGVSFSPPWSTVMTIVVAIVAPLTLVIVAVAGLLGSTRKHVRRALRVCGHDVCEGCGYRLEGVPAGHACPECGRREQASLGESDAELSA